MVEIPRIIIPPLEPGDGVPGGSQPVPTSRPTGGAVGVLWAPFVHQHAIDDVTGLQAALDTAGGVTDWNDLTGVPSTFPPSAHTHPQNEVTSLVADLAAKAALASPTFTGTPAAPTAAPATNTTQLATTAFVTAAVAAGGGGGTAAATTFTPTGGIASTDVQAALAELDAEKAPLVHTHPQSDVTNLVADLALKAPLSSPVLTGNPQAPTPSPGDNDTSIATTAFVTAAVAAGAGTDDQTAAEVPFTPAGNIAATNVQAALVELDTEKAPLADPDFTGEIDLIGTAGTSRIYYVKTSTTRRWGWGADNTTESGSEAGSDFVMRAYNDAGVYYGDAFQIDRSTLETSFWEDTHFLQGADFAGVVQTKTTQRVRQAVTATASTSINRNNGDYVDITMSASITTLTLSGWPASGTMGQMHLALTFTGAFTITWPAAVKWPGGTAPTLTGVSGKADHIMLVSDDGGTIVWGFVMGQNYDA